MVGHLGKGCRINERFNLQHNDINRAIIKSLRQASLVPMPQTAIIELNQIPAGVFHARPAHQVLTHDQGQAKTSLLENAS